MNKPLHRPSIMRQLFNLMLTKRFGKTLQPTKQKTFLPQGDSNHLRSVAAPLVEPNVFERMGEYQAILENHAHLSARRQYTNTMYISINTVVLTALGVLLLQSHLDTWWIFAMISAMTIIVLPINIGWQGALRRYGMGLANRNDYLREIEQEFRIRRGIVANQPEIGLFLRLKDAGLPYKGHTLLALYFLFLYPFISLIVGILIYLTLSLHFSVEPRQAANKANKESS